MRTILFDMGNVLVFFSHDRMCAQLGELCGRSGSEMRTLLLGSDLQWNFERGRFTEEAFCDALAERVQHPLHVDDVRRAGSDIFQAHDEMLPILQGLKQRGYRLVLLSNTSVSHFNWVQANYRFLDYFDDFTLSFEADAIKPEAPIYEQALQKIHCDPQDCFYTDDIPAYVDAGRNFGLQAEVFRDAELLKQHLREREVRFE